MSARIRWGLGAILAGVVGSSSAFAHHSYSQFDLCTAVTIVGEIKSIEWANPHIVLMLDADDGISYRVEWFDLRGLSRVGLEPEVLAAGDQVVITGSLHRDPAIKLMTVLRSIDRPGDNWRWARAQRARSENSRPNNCAA